MNLYKSNIAVPVNAENIFVSANLKTLEEEEKELCEGLIKEYEVEAVLKVMANGKSPDSNGFPAEFYKFFYMILVNTFYTV